VRPRLKFLNFLAKALAQETEESPCRQLLLRVSGDVLRRLGSDEDIENI
jgi:hypothetical protein